MARPPESAADHPPDHPPITPGHSRGCARCGERHTDLVTEPPSPSAAPAWSAVVLAGGTARRWAGRDKTAFLLAGEPVLVHAVRAVLPGSRAVAVVAPPGHPARPLLEALPEAAGVRLRWTREEPPGAGPVAGLAAGLAALPASTGCTDGDGTDDGHVVAVLAGDLPFTRTAWPRLLAALAADAGADAVLGVDPDGHRQPLLAVYRRAALAARLAAVPLVDQPLRVVTSGLRVITEPVTAQEALDLDTPADAEVAERIAASGLRA